MKKTSIDNQGDYIRTMKFISLRELRNETGKIKELLSEDRKIVVTDRGKPTAFMIPVDEASFEETLDTLRQARGLRALRELQRQAKENGLSGMSIEEIDAEIAQARKERREESAEAKV